MSFFKEWLKSLKIEKPIDQFYKQNRESLEWELIQLDLSRTCENCGEKAELQDGVCSPCGYKLYK